MEVEILDDVMSITISGNDIPVGTVFKGKIFEYGFYLRYFDGIVDLQDPQRTWGCNRPTTTPDVFEYQPFSPDKVKLIIG